MLWTDEQIAALAQKYVYTDAFESRLIGELTKVRTMYEARIAEFEEEVNAERSYTALPPKYPE